MPSCWMRNKIRFVVSYGMTWSINDLDFEVQCNFLLLDFSITF